MGAVMKVPARLREQNKVLKQAEISEPLWIACVNEIKRQQALRSKKSKKLTFRDMFEFGCEAFLAIHNPEAAAKLGIKLEEIKPLK